VVNTLDLVEADVGIQGIQLLPGQPVAGRDPERGLGGVPPSPEVIPATRGDAVGISTGADSQRDGLRKEKPTGARNGHGLLYVPVGGVQITTGTGEVGQDRQGCGQLDQ